MSSVLLIEDNAANRQSKAELLKHMAGRGPVVAVEGSDEAIRAVRALPRFDLIVADINLPRPGDRQRDENKDGISFARWLRRTGYPALLTGYSAHFEETQLPAQDLGLFHGFMGRGESPAEIRKIFKGWLEQATVARDELRGKPLQRSSDAGAPGHDVAFSEGVYSVDVIDLADERAINDLLKEGFTVKLARPKGIHKAGRPFFVWYRLDDSGAFVEVFGQPFLYGEAGTLTEAEDRLGVLMTGMLSDLRDVDPVTLGPALQNLRKFLKEVFGE